ncbi:MAG: hypothetical protein COA79_09080 [Planctomycetota bacterium]|nr:MAG: hypothetical protein COA79_09080 [Planctomycetota bacterium]
MKINLIIMSLLILICSVYAGDKNIPDGTDGFSGMVTGEIIKKEKNTLYVKIKEVKKLWKHNKAKKPNNLIGKTIKVNEGWHKPKGTKKYKPNKWHVNFIKKVKLGKVTLEIHTGDGDRFHLLELSHEQRKLAGVKQKKKD